MNWIHNILNQKKFWVLGNQAIFSATSFITTIVLARNLDPKQFGIYSSIIIGLYLLLSSINSLVIQPFQIFQAKAKNKEDYLCFNLTLNSMLLGGVIVIGLIVIKLPFFEIDRFQSLIAGIVYFTAAFITNDFFRKTFLGRAQVKKAFVLDSITVITHLTIWLFILINSVTLSNLFNLLALAYLPSIVFGLYHMKWKFNRTNWSHYLQFHVREGKWLFLTCWTQWWAGNLFVVSSGIFLGVEALGAFRLVQTLFGVLNVILQTFENYVLPRTSELLINSHTKAKQYLRNISARSMVLFGTVLVSLFIFSKSVIILAGGIQYAEYGFVVKGMCILYAVIFLGYPVRLALRSLVLNKNFFFGYLLSLLSGLISFKFLLSEFQLTGAIIGLIFSQIVVLGYWQYTLTKNTFQLWK